MKCEIIRDLLPSFLDGLTSEVSNEAVEQHLADCASCRSFCEEMRQEAAPGGAEGREIDPFLRLRRATFERIMVAVMLTAVVFSLLYGAGVNYMQGKPVRSDDVTIALQESGGAPVLVISPVEEEWYITLCRYGEAEPVDGKMPLVTIMPVKYRKDHHVRPPFDGRYALRFKGDVVVLDAHNEYDEPQEKRWQTGDIIAIQFDDGVKTLSLEALRQGRLEVLP